MWSDGERPSAPQTTACSARCGAQTRFEVRASHPAVPKPTDRVQFGAKLGNSLEGVFQFFFSSFGVPVEKCRKRANCSFNCPVCCAAIRKDSVNRSQDKRTRAKG